MCPPAAPSSDKSPSASIRDFLGAPIEICIATPNHLHTIVTLLRIGIGPWRVFTFSPANTNAQTYRGKPAVFSLKVAFAETPSGMTWEIMQPLPLLSGTDAEGEPDMGRTIIADFLATHPSAGPAGLVHHVAFDCKNIPWAERLVGFEERGFRCAMSGSWMGKNAFAFFEGPDGQSPLTFETYQFAENWVWPEADAVYGVDDLARLDAELARVDAEKQVGIEMGVEHTLPARTGVAVPLAKGQTIKVINTYGTQVVDFWGLVLSTSSSTSGTHSNVSEYTSMSHTRASTLKLSPAVNDILLTNYREPVLEMIEDTSPGVHDTLIAACDPARYRELGVQGWHASCAENFRGALRDVGIGWDGMMGGYRDGVPDPLNLFMNIPVSREIQTKVGELSWATPLSNAGDYVVFRALRECVVVMSACPQDLLKVNNMEPTSVEFVVEQST